MIPCAERAARAAGELELFAVNVAVRDLLFASRAAALVASERARATPTTFCASFTRGASATRSARTSSVLRSTSAPPSLVNVTLALRATAAHGALTLC